MTNQVNHYGSEAFKAERAEALNNDIPAEVLLKYALRERDNYKAKLDQLIPYTKNLEKTVAMLREDMAELQRKADKKEENQNEVARLRKLNKKMVGFIKQALNMYESWLEAGKIE
jgi:hypothetical protein